MYITFLLLFLKMGCVTYSGMWVIQETSVIKASGQYCFMISSCIWYLYLFIHLIGMTLQGVVVEHSGVEDMKHKTVGKMITSNTSQTLTSDFTLLFRRILY
jgi:hypothetical protein